MKKLLLVACAALGSVSQVYPVVVGSAYRYYYHYEPESFGQIVKDHSRAAAGVFRDIAPACAFVGALCGGLKGAGIGLGVGAGLVGTIAVLDFSAETSRFVSEKTAAKFRRDYKPFKKKAGYANFLRLGDNDFNVALSTNHNKE